jgi:Putative bacterial sensory transduction regulator
MLWCQNASAYNAEHDVETTCQLHGEPEPALFRAWMIIIEAFPVRSMGDVSRSVKRRNVMATREDIDHYLIEMGHSHETLKENMWVIQDLTNVVVTLEPPLVVFRAKLMEIPKTNREALFKLLLELNATQMIHGAYGLEDDSVVLIDSLQSENLDYNEFQATVEAFSLAITQDYEKLKAFRD